VDASEREAIMITRIFATTVAALLGVYAFWGDAVGGGHILNPFGIMFLLLAALLWFGWGSIREAFRSVKNESDLDSCWYSDLPTRVIDHRGNEAR
jgi:hypothetical protein